MLKKLFIPQLHLVRLFNSQVISLSAAISACERGQQWPEALQLFDTFRSAAVQLDLIACNSAVSACDKGAQWQAALHLLQDALRPDGKWEKHPCTPKQPCNPGK